MAIILWFLLGIGSSLCCIWIAGFHYGKRVEPYLEYCLIGGIGGILGALLMQNVIIILTWIFGPLFRILGLFFDGMFTSLLFTAIIITLFLRYLHPSTHRTTGSTSFLVFIFASLFLWA